MTALTDSLRGALQSRTAEQPTDPVLAGPGAPWSPKVVKAVERLRVEQGRLQQLRERLTEQQLAIDTDEAAAGEEVYNDPTAASRLAESLDRRRGEVRLQQRAVPVAEERVQGRVRDVLQGQIGDLRSRLRSGDSEVRARRETTARLLAELKEHEGAEYDVRVQHVDGYDRIGHQMQTNTGRLMLARRELAVLVWLLEQVAAGDPLPTFVTGQEQVTAYPLSISGPQSLVPGHPRVSHWSGGSVEPVLTALIEA